MSNTVYKTERRRRQRSQAPRERLFSSVASRCRRPTFEGSSGSATAAAARLRHDFWSRRRFPLVRRARCNDAFRDERVVLGVERALALFARLGAVISPGVAFPGCDGIKEARLASRVNKEASKPNEVASLEN